MTIAGTRFAVIGRGAMAARMRGLIGDVPPAEADAVYIASRNRDHVAHAIAALEAGKPVLCEKPFALEPAEAEAVVALAQRKRLLYMEAVATPFLPAVSTALEAARSGRIGRPLRLEASFGYAVSRDAKPRLFEADGGVLADRAVYPLMLALIAMGPVARSAVRVGRDAEGMDIAAGFELDHIGGGRSRLTVSLARRLDNDLRIEGDQGAVEVVAPLLAAQRISFGRKSPAAWRGLRQNPVVRRLADAAARVGGGWRPHGGDPYLHEIEHFVGLLRDGAIESPVVSHARMLEAAHLIAEARRS